MGWRMISMAEDYSLAKHFQSVLCKIRYSLISSIMHHHGSKLRKNLVNNRQKHTTVRIFESSDGLQGELVTACRLILRQHEKEICFPAFVHRLFFGYA